MNAHIDDLPEEQALHTALLQRMEAQETALQEVRQVVASSLDQNRQLRRTLKQLAEAANLAAEGRLLAVVIHRKLEPVPGIDSEVPF